MENLRSSKSMILSDLVAFYAIFGLKWVYFGQYDFWKSIFSPCGMTGYEHDLGRSETNLDVFYLILNLFFALEVQNHPNSESDTALRFQCTRILRALNDKSKKGHISDLAWTDTLGWFSCSGCFERKIKLDSCSAYVSYWENLSRIVYRTYGTIGKKIDFWKSYWAKYTHFEPKIS